MKIGFLTNALVEQARRSGSDRFQNLEEVAGWAVSNGFTDLECGPMLSLDREVFEKVLGEGGMGRIFFAREEQGGDRIANPDVKLEWRMQKDLSGPGALADFGSHMMDICTTFSGIPAGRSVRFNAWKTPALRRER